MYKSNLYWTLSYFCFTSLIYIEHFLILASIITGCISISAFTSLIGIPIGITIFAVGLKVFSIAGGIKKYKSIIKKKKNDKAVLLAKPKLINKEVVISKFLIDSVISHDELVLINNVPNEYEEMKEQIKISNNR